MAMGEEQQKVAKSQANITDFPGIMTKPDPDDIPSGAATDQVNIQSQIGALKCRLGYKIVSFDP
jgi:hypothetical protein